ncbi:MAG: hypothetical protein E7K85_03725 [Clostridium sp.]|uniref:hypothetical protein n=1 Tax=Clostridium TaxID=1485 RepID=UPI00066816D9|nr:MULTISPECIES: hypothetical protein [Clostridium]MBS7132605.1 hypothetical protein [Clostridium sp.]MDB2077358.1 hypothetical protein [Clostridium paraputrificum]MDB2091896.1 hypothetical protein [Clostridium paraputrificum]MDB2108316.1 hypothetical protein [Clostridium paraputrificum]MDB2120017.1 hypothetical protein [Clostridium paraputrificum]
MKLSFYYKLSDLEKYKRLKKFWPVYVIGIIIFYWKLDFWLASIISVILALVTITNIYYLNKKAN